MTVRQPVSSPASSQIYLHSTLKGDAVRVENVLGGGVGRQGRATLDLRSKAPLPFQTGTKRQYAELW